VAGIPLKTRRPFGWLARRANGGVSPQLVATARTLSSPRWRVDWDDVASVSIGTMPGMRCRSLRIEPVKPSDLQHKPSKTVGLLRKTLFDRPLEDIIVALSEKANRPLGRRPRRFARLAAAPMIAKSPDDKASYSQLCPGSVRASWLSRSMRHLCATQVWRGVMMIHAAFPSMVPR